MNIGGVISAFSGPPGVSVQRKVKNPALQAQLNAALTDYQGLRTAGQQGLSDYISKYLSNQSDESKFTGQEVGAASDFYNGNVANTLAQLRASRASAVNAAADVGAREAIQGVKGNALQGDGGMSSYEQREAMGAVIPIRAQTAVDEANQERADYGFTTQGAIDLMGKRSQEENQQAAQTLMPYQVRSQMNSTNMGTLGNLLQADQLNHFYGLRQNSNTAADVFNAVDQGVMEAASVYSSVASGMDAMKDGGLVRVRGYASGGEVIDIDADVEPKARKNFSGGGGNVRGPGGPTSDRVPAWLSDGEYVMPAKAVKMPGVLPLLEHIRQTALRDSTVPAKHKKGGYDMGGMVADWSDLSGGNSAASSQGPAKGGGGGGASAGLAAGISAMQERADRAMLGQWFPSSSSFGQQPAQPFMAPAQEGVMV